MHLIQNGVDQSFWLAEDDKTAEPRSPVVMSVGRLHPVKGHDVLLHALPRGVFVLPSRSEGLPLTLLEATLAGVPVVAARVGGVPDVLVPGTGTLVPPDDPVSLADAITQVLLDRVAMQDTVRRANERARQFSGARADEAYESLFVKVAGRKRADDAGDRLVMPEARLTGK